MLKKTNHHHLQNQGSQQVELVPIPLVVWPQRGCKGSILLEQDAHAVAFVPALHVRAAVRAEVSHSSKAPRTEPDAW